jgi:hypothetical protein
MAVQEFDHNARRYRVSLRARDARVLLEGHFGGGPETGWVALAALRRGDAARGWPERALLPGVAGLRAELVTPALLDAAADAAAAMEPLPPCPAAGGGRR